MSNSPTSAAAAPLTLPPDAQVLNIVTGAWTSAAVYIAAKLGIADLLKDGPKSAEFLAVATATDSAVKTGLRLEFCIQHDHQSV